MPFFNEQIFREPTEQECLSGMEFELMTMSGWVKGTYPSILNQNRQLDEFKDDNEMKLAHAITRVLRDEYRWLAPGSKVHYVPPIGMTQNGVFKSFSKPSDSVVYVVFKCNKDWDNYELYTSEATNVNYLKEGWV